MTENLLNQLKNTAGVAPASHWLQDCCNELQLSQQTVSVDAVLEQVLHHDLRDVVREFEGVEALSTHRPSVILRRAMQESLCAPIFKSSLPESFRLLVQVEELLDVSKNAEQRLSMGPASASAPTPIGNQNARCLKLFLSDGYYANGSAFQDENADQTSDLLVAMEIAPIPQLSVNSTAGIKVLLKGPIHIRHGILMCHPASAVVLGGVVEELAELQAKALQQAKRVAGVGVDPTIRALIWNPDAGEEEQEHDEGEHESRDVERPQAPPPVSAPATAPAPAPLPVYTPTSFALAPVPAPAPYLPPPPAAARPPTVATAPPRAIAAPRSQPFQSRSVPNAAATHNTVPAVSQLPLANPYATSQLSSATRSPAPLLQTTQSTSGTSTASTSPGTAAGPAPVQWANENSTAAARPSMSFATLRDMLLRGRESRELYQQTYDRSFVVDLQQMGTKLHFNIEKKKIRLNKKEDKYEYVMIARFGTGNEHDGLITCKVASAIMQPFFGHTPSDMRKLKKSNDVQSNELVKTGGRKLQEFSLQRHSYRVRLEQSPDHYFATASPPAIDGQDAVLYLQELVGE